MKVPFLPLSANKLGTADRNQILFILSPKPSSVPFSVDSFRARVSMTQPFDPSWNKNRLQRDLWPRNRLLSCFALLETFDSNRPALSNPVLLSSHQNKVVSSPSPLKVFSVSVMKLLRSARAHCERFP